MAWEDARQKIQQGTDYTDTVDVPFGDPQTGDVETVELTHRLLNENEYWNVASSIDTDAIEQTDPDEEVVEAQRRVTELQQKDDDELTEAEQRELEEKLALIQREQGTLFDVFGQETFETMMDVGKMTLVPSEADIDAAFQKDVSEQDERFGFVPSTRDQMREALELEMQEMVEEQPYPIKLIVGMKAWSESQSILGETDLNEGNPTQDA